jgi:hypothetical protein
MVLLYLANCGDDEGGNCFPSIATIAKASRCSDRTVIRSLAALEKDGWITVDHKRGRGNFSHYQLNMERLKTCQAVTFSEQAKPDTVSPIKDRKPDNVSPLPKTENMTSTTVKGDIDDTKGDIYDKPPHPLIGVNLKKHPQEKQKKAAFILPDWIPSEIWADYLEMRKKIGKPATDRAMTLCVSRLEELRKQGHGCAAVLEQSILNSWQGLFEIKQPKENVRYDNRKLSNIERNAPATREVIRQLREAGSDSAGTDGPLGLFSATGDTRPAKHLALPGGTGGTLSRSSSVGIQPSPGRGSEVLPNPRPPQGISRMANRAPVF